MTIAVMMITLEMIMMMTSRDANNDGDADEYDNEEEVFLRYPYL